MWEAGRLTMGAYTLLLSGAFGLVVQELRGVEWVAVFLAALAAVVAALGRRVVVQERMFFKYEWLLRRKLDDALGWHLKPPALHDTVPLKREARLQVIAPELEFDPGTDVDVERLKETLKLSHSEATDITHVGEVARTKGVFGVMMWLMIWGQRGATGAAFAFGAWLAAKNGYELVSWLNTRK